MIGNVSEWCADDSLPDNVRLAKGGGFNSQFRMPPLAKPTDVWRRQAGEKNNSIGFRCLLLAPRDYGSARPASSNMENKR
jgi:formylglycine-generating enzyme required for sulfatase activity